ncbi:permease [Fonticella tunisiensis]|uniref:Permease n=1 Tax=Fonticella tunisiensis TaxID=1096341 RepID=A0A4R7KCZ3_9CLOT|nr:permease [Fonticella tunisiensis]TDT51317.1 hypothetical protein EDD71_1181 [Fonticella tunisiensis]
MSQNLSTQNTIKKDSQYRLMYIILPIVFMLVAVIGLYYVKWNPYYNKAFVAASKHSIGNSIVSGNSSSAPAPSWSAAWGYAVAYFKSVWKAVVLGLLLGSLIQVALPKDWIKKIFGGKNFGSTIAAGAAALPGMMCSCCAAPVAVGLRKRSASINASMAFFLGNPTLNPATIIFMGFVLGWNFAVFRIIMGIILVFGISYFAGKFVKDEDMVQESLLSSKEEIDGDDDNLLIRWAKALWQLIMDTIPAYLIVVALLGAFRAWLFPAVDSDWANNIFAIILFSITGTLFVIPTAAEIPIVQTLMSFGLGGGPAATLLMTLPSVSLPSLMIIKRAFPKRVLVFVGVSVAIIGIVSGIIGMFVF